MKLPARSRQPVVPALVYLTAAAVLLAFANGRWAWAPAAWLSPAFLLLFLQSTPRVLGISIGFAAQLLAFCINWQGMIPVPGAWYYLVAGTYALFYYLPYVLHRLVAPRLAGFASTLVLPSAWVAIELFLQRAVTPYGSWASIAYTQVDQILLLQLASVAGTSGISFVIVWGASVLAWLWVSRWRLVSVRRGLAVFAIVMALVFGWGGYRLVSERGAPKNTVRLAGITPSAHLQSELMTEMERVRSEGLGKKPAALAGLAQRAARLNGDLVERTALAADGGAELVVWSEHAARVTPRTENDLIDDAALVARDTGAGILLGVGSWDPTATPFFENKLVAIEPDGSTAWTYHKARPIAGAESGLIVAGDSGVRTLDTAFGRIGAVICHDLDFPEFVRSAGRKGVDLLIGPSSDWREIATMHHRMAVVRAVENGCTLFRPCEGGISSAVDPFGLPIATSRETRGVDSTFAVEVPLYDLTTLYPKAGDWFAHANGVLILALLLLGWRGHSGKGGEQP